MKPFPKPVKLIFLFRPSWVGNSTAVTFPFILLGHCKGKRKGEEMKASSLSWWFLLLLGLNVLDVLVTNPAYESNPFTILMWEQLGIFLSAWIKIG
jgi:hypothetical protein